MSILANEETTVTTECSTAKQDLEKAKEDLKAANEDEEEQREAAELFHTTLPELSTRQERERAFHDILLAVKKNSYQYYMAKLGTDVNAVKQAVEGKKALEELQRTHISLE